MQAILEMIRFQYGGLEGYLKTHMLLADSETATSCVSGRTSQCWLYLPLPQLAMLVVPRHNTPASNRNIVLCSYLATLRCSVIADAPQRCHASAIEHL